MTVLRWHTVCTVQPALTGEANWILLRHPLLGWLPVAAGGAMKCGMQHNHSESFHSMQKWIH